MIIWWWKAIRKCRIHLPIYLQTPSLCMKINWTGVTINSEFTDKVCFGCNDAWNWTESIFHQVRIVNLSRRAEIIGWVADMISDLSGARRNIISCREYDILNINNYFSAIILIDFENIFLLFYLFCLFRFLIPYI